MTEIVVDNFALLESKKDRQNNNAGNNTSNSGNYSKNNSNGTNYDNNSQDPFNGSGYTIDISDDDLPF